jgi:hypothetical protein
MDTFVSIVRAAIGVKARTAQSVEVDGSDSTPRTADADADADGEGAVGAVGAAATDDDDSVPEADAIGAEVAGEDVRVAPGDVVVGPGVACRETARDAVVLTVALRPMPRTSAATTPLMSSGTAPMRRLTGSSSRHRGQNPETGVVV